MERRGRGIRARLTLLGAAAAAALALAPSQSLASPADVAATHAYIVANNQLARTSVARIGVGQARIERLIHAFALECPGAGAGSPQDEQTHFFNYEAGVALWSVAYGTNAAQIRRFAATVRGLRWTNPAITRAAQSYAGSLQAMATLPVPPLCQDVRAWRANGYQTVPAQTTGLVRRVEAIELKPLPQRMLAGFERGADASTFARTLGLEKRLEESESNPGEGDLLRLLDALTLQE
ncbi:MAG TPA: hypothetical protein VGN08_14095 [Solirubrobacteraceae bacterium]